MKTITLEQAARIVYAAVHQLNTFIDDKPVAWEDLPEQYRQGTINGVRAQLLNPDRTPEESHNEWMKDRAEQGYVWGPVKDHEKKEHPCMRPYKDLPVEQRIKDGVFQGNVRALAPIIVLD